MEKCESCKGTEMTFESVDNDTDEEGFWKKMRNNLHS